MARSAEYQAVVRRMNMLIDMALMEPTGPQLIDVLCTTVPSEGADEGYEWLGSMPGMREWVGPRKFKQLLAYEYAIKNKKFESSIELEKDRVKDDLVLRDVEVCGTHRLDDVCDSVFAEQHSANRRTCSARVSPT